MDDRKAPLAPGSQAAPSGMAEVSEEEDLQAAEEVSTLYRECHTHERQVTPKEIQSGSSNNPRGK